MGLGEGQGGRGWLEQSHQPGLQNPSGTVPALTSFSLPGANGFPCCDKESVDIVDTQ